MIKLHKHRRPSQRAMVKSRISGARIQTATAIPPPLNWVLECLERETVRPFRGLDRLGWHIWIEEWSPTCIEWELKEDDIEDGDGTSYDAEERRALDVAMAEFSRDLVRNAPGRAPDYEDYYNTNGIFGYQIVMWRERPGEDWSHWTDVISGMTNNPEDGFGIMRRVVPLKSVRAPARRARTHR